LIHFENNNKFVSETNKKITNLENKIAKQIIKNKWDIIDYLESNDDIKYKSNECPLCNFKISGSSFTSIKSICLFGGGELKRYQCPECSLIYGPLKMLKLSDYELTQEYEMHYSIYDEGDSTDAELKAFLMLEPNKAGSYLNYGAGSWSKSIEILLKDGWSVYSYEPHESANKKTEYFIKSKKELMNLKFDGIFTNNVIEHLKDPINDFNFLKSLLKPNGKISHATTCYEYLYDYTRFHLFFYLGRSKEILANKTNMEIVKFVKDNEFMCMILKNK
jgi:SAM-dependent methyltransferase